MSKEACAWNPLPYKGVSLLIQHIEKKLKTGKCTHGFACTDLTSVLHPVRSVGVVFIHVRGRRERKKTISE